MTNIKKLLVEKERLAYIRGQVSLAKFFADTLDYIGVLEETINKQALEIENIDNTELTNAKNP